MLTRKCSSTALLYGLLTALAPALYRTDHISASAQNIGACAPVQISAGQTASGNLGANGCRSLARGTDYFAIRYSFNAPAGTQISIALGSLDFDTYLYLIGPGGTVVAKGDDNDGGSDSRIPRASGLFTLLESGTYIIEATSYSPNRTGAYRLSFGFQPAGCAYALAPANQSFGAGGGAGSVNVTAGGGCSWQTFNSAGWITINSGSGGGDGTVSYSVAANPGLGSRAATLYIAGQSFVVTQAGCVSISPSGQNFNAGGGAGGVNVTTAGDCQWTATSDNNWITITGGGSGAGAGMVSYSVANNSGFNARSGTISIAGSIFIITQAGLHCPTEPVRFGQTISGALGPNDCRSAARGDEYYADRYSFNASAGAQIAVAVDSSLFDTYVYLLSPNGSVVARDDDGAGGSNTRLPPARGFFSLPVSGGYVIEVTSFKSNSTGGYVLSLIGESQPCAYSIAPTSQSFPSSGGAGRVAVVAPSGCDWTAASNDGWIAITAGAPGSGNGAVDYSVLANTGSNPRTGTMAIAGRTFTVTQAGVAPVSRIVRIAPASGAPGSVVNATVELLAQGDENALGFSLDFDPAVLSYTQTELGAGALGASLNLNTTQTAQGRLGIALAAPTGQTFAQGARRLVVVSLTIASGATAPSTAINFGDQPVARAIVDVNANTLVADYVPGLVMITSGAAGIEADVSPRPGGNGAVTIADWVQVGRFASGLDTAAPGGEFQRADCAPRNTLGNGLLTISDWVQAGRYAAGLDAVAPAGGPSAPAGQVAMANSWRFYEGAVDGQSETNGEPARGVRMTQLEFEPRRGGALAIEFDAAGDENALGFSLDFDASRLSLLRVAPGAAASDLAININIAEAARGRLGFALALPPGRTFAAGAHQLAIVIFTSLSGEEWDSQNLGFGDHPVAREITGVEANVLPHRSRSDKEENHVFNRKQASADDQRFVSSPVADNTGAGIKTGLRSRARRRAANGR